MSKFVLRNLNNERRRLEKQIEKVDKRIDKIKNTRTIAEGTLVLGTTTKFEKIFNKVNNKIVESEITVSARYDRYKNEITCTLVLDDVLFGYGVFVGKSRCSKDDEFDVAVGMCIAECRAIQKLYEYMIQELGE